MEYIYLIFLQYGPLKFLLQAHNILLLIWKHEPPLWQILVEHLGVIARNKSIALVSLNLLKIKTLHLSISLQFSPLKYFGQFFCSVGLMHTPDSQTSLIEQLGSHFKSALI